MLSLQKLLTGCGVAATLWTLGCNDYLSGQEPEPQGPLQVKRLTLFDASSRDHAVFTDTSLPDCKPVETKQKDCSTHEAQQEYICRVCFLDTFKDTYSPAKSPPTPDSGRDIRVVFNKAALQADGKDLANEYDPVKDKDTTDAGKANLGAAVKLSCPSCSGLPPQKRVLIITGSDVTFDPTTIPYGPSIKLATDTTDPRAALEPDSAYTVQVDSRISGRDGQGLMQPEASLLNFKTEKFQVLQVKGHAKNVTNGWVYGAENPGAACSKTYCIEGQSPDSAIELVFNAPLHAASLATVSAMATLSGGGNVMVKVGTNVFGAKDAMKMTCPQKNQRSLYIYPDGGASWPMAEGVDIRIPGGSLFDVKQGGTFDKGTHSIPDEITINVKFAKMPVTGFTKSADAMKAGACL